MGLPFLLPLIMFDFIADAFAFLIGQIVLSGYGAFLRWLLHGFKKPYSYYYANKDGKTIPYGVFGIAITIIAIIYIHYRISN